MHHDKKHQHNEEPTWSKKHKWKLIVVIIIVIAMPLFFSYARTMQTQQVIDNSNMNQR